MKNKSFYLVKRATAGFLVLLIFTLLLSIVFVLGGVAPAGAQAQAEYIFDEEICSYSGSMNIIVSLGDLYNNDAQFYTDTQNVYAECLLSGVTSNTTYLVYAWVRSDPAYGEMRYAVDNESLGLIDFSDSPNGWISLGTIEVGPFDLDTPVMVIDREDTGSGWLFVDAVRLIGIPPIPTPTYQDAAFFYTPTTVIYTLPTTLDPVLYERKISSGDVLISAPLWALVILNLFVETWKVSRGA